MGEDLPIGAAGAQPRETSPGEEGDRSDVAGARCHVVHEEQVGELRLTRDGLERLQKDGGFFWIDLHKPTAQDLELLREVFQFHQLALEDSEHFGQRAKIDDYDDFVFIVVYGAVPDEDRLVEVHCFYSERFLITLHHDEAPAFGELRRRYRMRKQPIDKPSLLLYRIVEALVDSFFPVLGDFDDRIDELENRTFLEASEEQLQEIFAMKRLLVGMRKAIAPQRDMFASLMGGVAELPGMSSEDERYFRDIYDHLIRISDLIDTYRDLLTSSMDVFLSTVSNRLNVVMKQLAVIATVFLPLTFITGFFGQNFAWMVRHISGWQEFVALGVGTEIVVVVLLMILFKRRGWL